jgi:integrase
MSRQGKRKRIAESIYQDRSGLSAIARIGVHRQEKRFPPGTELDDIRAWLERTKAQLRKQRHQPEGRGGTLGADSKIYGAQLKHLVSYRTRLVEIEAWVKALGANTLRAAVTQEDVHLVRVQWLKAGASPKTINNRVQTLRHWYRTLDGRRSVTPCDDVRDLAVHKTPPVVVPADLIERVDADLQRRETTGDHRRISPEWRAWFRLLATTGKRPSEILRTQPGDLDLERRVWIVRDGKGGYSPGLYLNDEMLLAWQFFLAVNAGRKKFYSDRFAEILRESGWPVGVRVYNLRHTTWITASERGADLADIQAGAGHKQIATTRRHYVPVLNSRMQRLSELIDHRFTWHTWAPPVPPSVPPTYVDKSQKIRQFAPRPLAPSKAKEG